ncbi:hypothetical protein IMSAGC015_02386 [Lachnospiraceae bacterium]|nr:hypothetical protein IMSAGC015_02386 [Lachnospiraceae bacterium]
MLLSKLHHHCNAVHPRHHHIHNGQMDILFLDYLKPLDAVLRLNDFISLAFQIYFYTLADFFVIFHHEHMIYFHFCSPSVVIFTSNHLLQLKERYSLYYNSAALLSITGHLCTPRPRPDPEPVCPPHQEPAQQHPPEGTF